MTWHADATLLARYANGEVDQARASSVEAHVIACAVCRSALATAVDRARLEHIWSGVRLGVQAPRPRAVERVLRWLGTPDHYARLLAATPSLTASWLLAVAVALVFAVAVSHRGPGNPLPFLIIAPLLPLAGVAAAFAPGMDPTYEVGVASPMRGAHLLMVRGSAVFAATSVLAGIASLALPDVSWTAAAWLAPALALSLSSLALSTWMSPALASGGLAAVWITGVVATLARPGVTRADQLAWFRPAAQVAFCIVFVIAAIVVMLRGDRLDRGNER
jgi:hypothetical protein